MFTTFIHIVPPRAMPRVSSRRVRVAALMCVAVALQACDNSIQPVPARVAAPTERVAIISDPARQDWNLFDADVNLSFYGQSAGTSLPNPSRAVGYHVHRYQDSYGAWRANYTHANYRPYVANAPGDMDPPRIAQAYGAGAGVTPSFYDMTGAAVYLEQPLGEQPTGNGKYGPAAGASGPQVPPPPSSTPYLRAGLSSATRRQDSVGSIVASATRGNNVGASPSSRVWLDRYVVTPAAAQRTRERLTAMLGPGRARANGRTRFSTTRGRHTVDIDLDDARGIVSEMRVSVDGQLQAITSREYVQDDAGHLVLAKERIVRMLPDGASRSMEAAYSNITLSRKED